MPEAKTGFRFRHINKKDRHNLSLLLLSITWLLEQLLVLQLLLLPFSSMLCAF